MTALEPQAMPVGSESEDFGAIALHDVELSQPLPTLASVDAEGRRFHRAHVLVRLHTRPLGVLELDLGEDGLSAQRLAEEISDRLKAPLAEHLKFDGLQPTEPVGPQGLAADPEPRCLAARRAALTDPPRASVIVPTRDRPEVVRRCLKSLESLDYPSFEIILVDGSAADTTSEIVRSEFPRVKYFRLGRGGSAVSRNRGLATASGEVIAFTDDDAVVDRHWLTEHVAALGASERVGCTTGLVLPLELRTRAQLWFEESGAFVQGFERRDISLEDRGPGSLLPFATGRIGASVNMVARADVMREIGGWDPAMDSWTGEDLAVFFDILCAGYHIVYEPGALVFHEHRRTYAELRRQIYVHAVGLGAHMTRCLVTQPKLIPDFVRRVPRGIRYGFTSSSSRNLKKSPDYPASLTRIEYLGVIRGPLAYLQGVRAAHAQQAGDTRAPEG